MSEGHAQPRIVYSNGYLFWHSPCCPCVAGLFRRKIKAYPCEGDHLIWLYEISRIQFAKEVEKHEQLAQALAKRGIVGITTDNFLVIGGSFKFVDTHGLPLEILITESRKLGFEVSLPHFIDEAIAAGWSRDKAMAVVNESTQMLYGPEQSRRITSALAIPKAKGSAA